MLLVSCTVFLYCCLTAVAAETGIEAVHENGDPLKIRRGYYRDLIMVLQWPPGLCYQTWCRAAPQRWTIHGLWPNSPQDCYESSGARHGCKLNFRRQHAGNLLGMMERKWPSLKGWSYEEFWEHEYCKHGTCCDDILTGPTAYFKGTLELFDSIVWKLWAANITPSNDRTYEFDDVERALSFRPKYWCRQVGDKQILYQLGVSVRKSFDFTDGNNRHSRCRTYKPFYLLTGLQVDNVEQE